MERDERIVLRPTSLLDSGLHRYDVTPGSVVGLGRSNNDGSIEMLLIPLRPK